jgi:hypothetical protein
MFILFYLKKLYFRIELIISFTLNEELGSTVEVCYLYNLYDINRLVSSTSSIKSAYSYIAAVNITISKYLDNSYKNCSA